MENSTNYGTGICEKQYSVCMIFTDTGIKKHAAFTSYPATFYIL